MTERTLTVTLTLRDDEHFEICVLDNETGMNQSFNQDTLNIEEKIGVEVMSWLDMMEVDDDE